jgi:hypothetical protein
MSRHRSARRALLGGTVLTGLLLAGIIVVLLSETNPLDLGRLASEGPIRELRDELRPASPAGPRVLLLALDGVSDQAFREGLADGLLPALRTFLGAEAIDAEIWDHAWAPTGALSILPSTTYAAWTAVFTGAAVAESGIPGNEWYDRSSRRFVAPAPTSVEGLGDVGRVYSEGLMGDWIGVPTLFERADVRSYATLVAQHQGADILIHPDLSTLRDIAMEFVQGVQEDGSPDLDLYKALDRQAIDGTLAALEEYGVPDLLAVYLPGIDLHTHVAPESASAKAEYLAEVVAPLVDEVLRAYRGRGVLDDTWVVLTSDHGHTPVLDSDRNALGMDPDEGWPGIIANAGFWLRPFERETSVSTYQAVLAYQGAFANLYLADRSTCTTDAEACDWTRGPDVDRDLIPLLRILHEANLSHPELAGSLDLILAREPRGLDAAEPFRVWDGTSLVPVGDFLDANPRPDLIDFAARLQAMSEGPLGHRAGDVLLMARLRFEDPIEKRFYFSGPYHSWHGSASARDSEILWVLARSGMSGSEVRRWGSEIVGDRPGQLDITPLILGLLRGFGPPASPAPDDGGRGNPAPPPAR